MIIDKKIVFTTNRFNNHVGKRVKENCKIGDEISIHIEKLKPSDKVKIKVECRECGEKINILYEEYVKNLKRNNGKFICAKCNRAKNIKKTFLEKYGVENVSYLKEVVEKRKQTSIENCGFDNHMKNPELLKKFKENNLKKYGYETPFNSKEILEKCTATTKRIYGVDNVFQSEEIKEKSRKTCLEKYGFENAIQLRSIYDKTLKTKFGDDYLLNRSDYREYELKVRRITKRNKKELIEKWDGKDYYDGEYIKDNFNLNYNHVNYPTIDHKKSIVIGYKLSIPPEIIGGIDNLCFTKRTLNSQKSFKKDENFLN